MQLYRCISVTKEMYCHILLLLLRCTRIVQLTTIQPRIRARRRIQRWCKCTSKYPEPKHSWLWVCFAYKRYRKEVHQIFKRWSITQQAKIFKHCFAWIHSASNAFVMKLIFCRSQNSNWLLRNISLATNTLKAWCIQAKLFWIFLWLFWSTLLQSLDTF